VHCSVEQVMAQSRAMVLWNRTPARVLTGRTNKGRPSTGRPFT
jgi:hypothetical protein